METTKVKRTLTRKEVDRVRAAVKREPAEGLVELWRILEPRWDELGPGSVDPDAYAIPRAQAMAIMKGAPRPFLFGWLNWGPSTY